MDVRPCNSVPRSVEVVETVYTFSQLPSKAIDQTRAQSASSVRQLQHPALIAEKLSKRKWCQSKILMHVTVNNPEMSSCNLRKWLLSCFLAFCSTGTITLYVKQMKSCFVISNSRFSASWYKIFRVHFYAKYCYDEMSFITQSLLMSHGL